MNLEKFTERARGFLNAGQTIAARENHQQLKPEHLLKAFLDDVDGGPFEGQIGATANVTGSGANYTVTVTGMNGFGTVVASIPAAAAIDGSGIATLASTSTDNTVTFDGVSPAVAINQSIAQADPTHFIPIYFEVRFSEDDGAADTTFIPEGF